MKKQSENGKDISHRAQATKRLLPRSARINSVAAATVGARFEISMPIRLLRPGITTSKRFNRLDWIAQIFYVRLLTQIDDYGRFEADHMLLRSACFPLGDQNGVDVPLLSIASICQQLTAQNLAVFYKIGDTEYVQVTRWKERIRSESKYPGPECAQLPANDSNCQQMTASPPAPTPSSPPSYSTTPAPTVDPPPGFPKSESEAVAIGERSGVPANFATQKFNEAAGVGYVDWNSKPIRSFAHWIKSEWVRHEGRNATPKPNGSRVSLEIRQRNLKDELKRLKDTSHYEFERTPEKLKQIADCEEQLKKVNKQLE